MAVKVVGPLTDSVAVTVGLGETPAALNVITQEWLPVVAVAAVIEALTVCGVEPDVGDKLSHPQSDPSEDVNASPLNGLVLLNDIVCAAGTVPPVK